MAGPGSARDRRHRGYLYADDKLLTAFLAVEAYHEQAIGGTALPPADHDQRVDAIVAAAPLEHRSWAEQILRGKNSKGQRRKLREVLDRAGKTGARLEQALPGFVNRAVTARQQVAHPATYDEDAGARYLFLSLGLRWILRHCLLVDLGLDEDQVAAIIAACREFATTSN